VKPCSVSPLVYNLSWGLLRYSIWNTVKYSVKAPVISIVERELFAPTENLVDNSFIEEIKGSDETK